ncbi:MAG: hypothetical protein ABIR35_00450 [Polaromonas sp.]
MAAPSDRWWFGQFDASRPAMQAAGWLCLDGWRLELPTPQRAATATLHHVRVNLQAFETICKLFVSITVAPLR